MIDVINFLLFALHKVAEVLWFGCAVMTLIESVLTWKWVALPFSHGPVLVTHRLDSPLEDLQTQQPISVGLATARFKAASDSRLLVQLGMPFLVRGTIETTADGSVLCVRTSLGFTLCMAFWLVGWSTPALGRLLAEEVQLGLGLLLLGWIAVGAFYWGARSSELRKVRRVIAGILPPR